MAIVRVGTDASAAANNWVLAKGEMGYTSDGHVLKVGDGVTAWSSLTAIGAGGGLTTEQVQDIVGAMVTGNTETGITVTYQDGDGTIDFVTDVTTAYTDEMAQDAINTMLGAGTLTRITKSYNDGANSMDLTVAAFPILIPFSLAGALTTGAGTKRIYNPAGRTITVKKITTSVVTAPTGAALVVDGNINGTTMYTTQGNRPSIAASANVSTSGLTDAAASGWDDGEYITIDVDQIGSTVAGSDLTGVIYGEI